MKLAFTTLGCPNWNLDQIIGRSLEYGYDGIDFRGYLKTLDVTEAPEFSTQAQETAKKIADTGLEVPCFSTSISVNGDEKKQQDNLTEIHRYAKLCPIFGARFLRVFGHGEDSPRERVVENFVANIQPLLKVAADYGAVILIETHDQWTESSRINEVVERVNSPFLRVLWDIHHPWKASKEAIDYTWETMGKWVEYTHWKDATPADKLCLMGEGILPLEEWYCLLKAKGYSGYCTLEWEKRWYPEMEEPEVAFPDFTQYMNRLEEKYKEQP